MSIRIVRLGSARHSQEGTRLGTVRRPPRGVRKTDYARRNFYDSVTTMKLGLGADNEPRWAAFARKYRAEMKAPAASQSLDVLAALSHHASFSVGCYCEDEARCHRSLLRELLRARGAQLE